MLVYSLFIIVTGLLFLLLFKGLDKSYEFKADFEFSLSKTLLGLTIFLELFNSFAKVFFIGTNFYFLLVVYLFNADPVPSCLYLKEEYYS